MLIIQECFFNVNEMFKLSTENFYKQWTLVNNVWIRFNGYLLDNGDERKTFVCRLSKPKESSRRNENVPPKKLCITWKNPTINYMVANEAIKDYKPLTIVNIIRMEVFKVCKDSSVKYLKTKKVTNIKQKLVGSI
ncbi:36783_t:CDS:2, partial [Gigaspora margarita]